MFNPSGKQRSQTDTTTNAIPNTIPIPAEYRAKLDEYLECIQKEFDLLYMENISLRQRVGASVSNEAMPSESPSLVGIANLSEGVRELAKGPKRGSQMRQKWKTAFKGPSGRLVTSLKVGSGNAELSKSRYMQNFAGHSDAVWDLAAFDNSSTKVVASASADQTAKVFNADNGRLLVNYVGHTGSVNSISLYSTPGSEDLCMVSAGGDKTVHIWKASHISLGSAFAASSEDDIDAASEKFEEGEDTKEHLTIRQPTFRLTGHTNAVVCADWLADGKQILTASWDRTANMYDSETGKIINTLNGHDQELTHCKAHETGRLVATSSKDFTFRLWDFREAIQSVSVFQGHNDAVTSVVFASSHYIISGSDDRTIKVWDLRNMRSPISATRFDSPVNRLAVNHKEQLLAVPQDNRHITIFDISTFRVLARLPRSNNCCHCRMVTSTAWLPDHQSNNLITSSIDRQIIGWKVPRIRQNN